MPLGDDINIHIRIPNIFKKNKENQLSGQGRSNLSRFLLQTGLTISIVILLMATQNVWAEPLGIPVAAPATAPSSATSINYQGRLFDQGTGNPITGAVNLEFVIYDAATGGNVIWGPEAHNSVTVNDGLFDVALGDTIPLSPSLFGQDRWLETSVGGETLSPRQQLLSVPVAQYALKAQEATGVSAGAIGSRELAPTVWVMDSGTMNVEVSGYQPYVELTIEDDTVSHWLVWWFVGTTLKSGGQPDGVVEGNLYVDGSQVGFAWGQSARIGSGGSSTATNMVYLELEAGIPHVLRIHGGGVSGAVLRHARIIAIPLTSNGEQDCSGQAGWVSSPITDALSGASRSDSTTCNLFNFP